MTFRIRQMTETDIDAVLELGTNTEGSPHWTRENYLHLFERPGTQLVAEVDRQLAGFAMATLATDIGELETIVVAAQFRRQGIGAAFLRDIIAWSQEAHAERVELEVRCSNHSAIALYERSGFVHDGIRRAYYSNPEEDALLMGLDLDPPAETVEKNP
jgi:[ribosomal protein S18]-alanine N-acetyltransferase